MENEESREIRGFFDSFLSISLLVYGRVLLDSFGNGITILEHFGHFIDRELAYLGTDDFDSIFGTPIGWGRRARPHDRLDRFSTAHQLIDHLFASGSSGSEYKCFHLSEVGPDFQCSNLPKEPFNLLLQSVLCSSRESRMQYRPSCSFSHPAWGSLP